MTSEEDETVAETADAESTVHSDNERLLPNGSTHASQPTTVEEQEELGWQGWILVAAVLISFVVIPLVILYFPEVHQAIGALGFSRRQAFIAFPMVPAILLGLIAVWAAVQ